MSKNSAPRRWRRFEIFSARGKHAIVVGGSGLYVKALTHGLSPLPGADPKLRAAIERAESSKNCAGSCSSLIREGAAQIDLKNRRRVDRARSRFVCSPANQLSAQLSRIAERGEPRPASALQRAFSSFAIAQELYERINRRVEKMFAEGVVEEVRALRRSRPDRGKSARACAKFARCSPAKFPRRNASPKSSRPPGAMPKDS